MPSPTTSHDAHDGESLAILTVDVLLGVRWYEIPQLDSLTHFRARQAEYLARLAPRKAIVVSVSNAAGELRFDPGSRELVEAVMVDAKTHLVGMAQIVLGDGFGAASVRSVLSGIQLAVRPDYPVRFFGDVASAEPWLEELLVAAGHPELVGSLGTEVLAPLAQPRATAGP